jgi:diguanylate cyclase
MTLSPMATKAKILIVEDELIVAENIARHLRKEGYEVVAIVDTGEDAIREALSSPINLVLMDIMLQGDIDGVTATEIIHSELQVPVIYMTAYVDDTTLERAKLTNPYGYLVKPFKPQDLKVNIEIALQKHQGEIEARNQHSARLENVKQQLEQLLHHDPLTNLLNWQTLQQEFSGMTEELTQEALNRLPLYSSVLPVFCLGIDRFERLRNCFGQDAITRLLQIIARRIAQAIGSHGKVARTDADEFVVLLEPVKRNGLTKQIATDILTAIAEPFILDEREVLVTASMGIATYPHDSDQLETLFQCGRYVRQQLQAKGGNAHGFYQRSQPLPKYDPDLLILEKDLHQALESEQLYLVYQPRVELSTGRIVGAEALTRWRHPERGNISPAIFIPLAEESGLIEPLGEWVLKSACQQLHTWQKEQFPPLQIAVNFSGCQLRRRNLAGYLGRLLEEMEISTDLLELELTESALIEDIPLAVQNMNAIKELGIKIAIDDFGTGYSSLSHLHQFSFDILKLDRSFVAGIQMNRKNAAIAKAIITMAHQLNLRVVAEGVETPEELVYLRHHQCDEIQGYLFSPPILPSEFAKLVQKNHLLT